MSLLLPGFQPPSSDEHPVYARSGWRIPTGTVDDDLLLTQVEMRIRASEWLSWRGGLEVRSLSIHPYNCVGMIFASRRAFIEIDYIYDILREDGYRRISLEQVVAGDVVLYRYDNEPSHVALVTNVQRIGQTVSVRVLSKWGLDPEFEHFMENVSVRLGVPTEFYTERVL